MRTHQKGFSVIEIVVVVAVVAVAGLLGYSFYNHSQKVATTTPKVATSSVSQTAIVPSAPAINSTSDLDKASAALDQINVGSDSSSDSSQLDNQSAF